MSFIISDTTVRYIDEDAVDIRDDIPTGFWKYCFSERSGSFLMKARYSTSHGKIYGDSLKIARHVINRYSKVDLDTNLGVLLSGGKGLGKSLTTRLIIKSLCDTYPIIIVDSVSPDLPDFLTKVHDCVILFDEFEKTFSTSPDDEGNGATWQEQLLPVLDGTDSDLHNLFLFTVNDTYRLNDNLLSRPGRIKYHYVFNSCGEDVIREYCKDNLDDDTLIDSVVSELLAVKYVSLDIISALVDELNTFNVSVHDAMKYLNISKNARALCARIKYKYKNKIHTFRKSLGSCCSLDENLNVWIDMEDEANDFGNMLDESGFYVVINTSELKGDLSNWLDVTNISQISRLPDLDVNNVSIVSVEIIDSDVGWENK